MEECRNLVNKDIFNRLTSMISVSIYTGNFYVEKNNDADRNNKNNKKYQAALRKYLNQYFESEVYKSKNYVKKVFDIKNIKMVDLINYGSKYWESSIGYQRKSKVKLSMKRK
ncbi:hypothetical protein Glove_271g47 [Diversispora epigaea]|uniref:Uncharacterized protein n=1 Tax=Diversispora epigaea TaxID=1348612 RepID=A0A397IC99_9GLOM|nr:hypothetical protein Glove_271g47 [Diversispora epigaea]